MSEQDSWGYFWLHIYVTLRKKQKQKQKQLAIRFAHKLFSLRSV